QLSGRHWLHAATLYNIAAYPHLKGDDLAEQAQALSNRAYEEAQSAPLFFPCSGDIMKVAKDLVVSLAYQVRTEDGVLVDESPVS
ncbi:alpha/beta hydrolase, partial [Escherichia coli]|uniref:alpha/beta hydrolase n=1 Tax=Escherichia coli TaxID=562 RepID=UPI001F25C9E5